MLNDINFVYDLYIRFISILRLCQRVFFISYNTLSIYEKKKKKF